MRDCVNRRQMEKLRKIKINKNRRKKNYLIENVFHESFMKWELRTKMDNLTASLSRCNMDRRDNCISNWIQNMNLGYSDILFQNFEQKRCNS